MAAGAMGLDYILYYHGDSGSSLYFDHCLAQLHPCRSTIYARKSFRGISQDDQGLSKGQEVTLMGMRARFALLSQCDESALLLNEERRSRGGGSSAEERYPACDLAMIIGTNAHH